MEKLKNNPYKKALCKIENDYENKVREELYDSGEYADVTFLVGPKQREFKAHRFVLITSSYKFKQMMELGKDLEKPILIPEIEAGLFDQLLSVIYLHRLELHSFENAVACCKLFEEFGLPAAVKECQEYMKQPVEVTIDNAIPLYEMYLDVPERSDIVQQCVDLFSAKTLAVLKSVGFSRAHAKTIAFIFDQPLLNIDSELDLLNILRDFAEMHGALPAHNTDGNDQKFKELVKPALEKIHLMALDPRDIVKSESLVLLLTKDEIAGLLAHKFVAKNPLFKFPVGFSLCNVDRGGCENPQFQDAEDLRFLSPDAGFAYTAEIDSQITETPKITQHSVDWTPSKVSQGKAVEVGETSDEGTMEPGNPIGNSTLDSEAFAGEENTVIDEVPTDQSTTIVSDPEKTESIVCVPDIEHLTEIADDKSFRSTNGNVSPAVIQSVWVKKIDENQNYNFSPKHQQKPKPLVVIQPLKSPAPGFNKNQAPFKPQAQRPAPANQVISKADNDNDEWA